MKTTLSALIALTVLAGIATPASARQCKRICQDGVCWWDCSKIPGQPVSGSLRQKPTQSTPLMLQGRRK